MTLTFWDGYVSTRDLIDHAELVRYITAGVAMWNTKSIVIVHNVRPES